MRGRFVVVRCGPDGRPLELVERQTDIFRSKEDAEVSADGWNDYHGHKGTLNGCWYRPFQLLDPDDPFTGSEV